MVWDLHLSQKTFKNNIKQFKKHEQRQQLNGNWWEMLPNLVCRICISVITAPCMPCRTEIAYFFNLSTKLVTVVIFKPILCCSEHVCLLTSAPCTVVRRTQGQYGFLLFDNLPAYGQWTAIWRVWRPVAELSGGFKPFLLWQRATAILRIWLNYQPGTFPNCSLIMCGEFDHPNQIVSTDLPSLHFTSGEDCRLRSILLDSKSSSALTCKVEKHGKAATSMSDTLVNGAICKGRTKQRLIYNNYSNKCQHAGS